MDATLQIFFKFRPELTKKGMLQMSNIMMEAALMVIGMETNGVLIDQSFVEATIPKLEELLRRYETELATLAGKRVDWNSNAEIAKYLYDELGLVSPYGPGTRPTDDDALDRINTPLTSMLRKYRKASKLCGTYFKGYFSKVDADGRLRGRYWLNETASCRLSSSDPNL